MQMTFMEAISITVSSMTIVLVTLGLIALILTSFKFIFKEKKVEIKEEPKRAVNEIKTEEDEEEKVVAALITSILAAEDLDHNNFHIKSIKRVK